MVSRQQINAVKSYLDDLSAEGNFNGTVLVGQKDKILFTKAYGYANFEWKVKNTIDTKFKLGSLTKPFTACLIILLAQKGLLQFQDKISKYIENTPDKWKDITIHHLLTHTSGILNFQRHKDWGSKNMYNTFKPLDFLEIIFKMKQEFKPGKAYSYSNSAYYLLGIIIERITKLSYEEAMREFIFKPLNMLNSGLCSELDIIPKFANGYTMNNSKNDLIEKARYENMSIPYSAGGLYSTVEDLFKWSQGLENEVFLSKKYYHFLLDGNNYENNPFHRIVSYGWVKNTIKVTDNLTKTILHHNGVVFGFNSRIDKVLEDNITVIFLSNLLDWTGTRTNLYYFPAKVISRLYIKKNNKKALLNTKDRIKFYCDNKDVTFKKSCNDEIIFSKWVDVRSDETLISFKNKTGNKLNLNWIDLYGDSRFVNTIESEGLLDVSKQHDWMSGWIIWEVTDEENNRLGLYKAHKAGEYKIEIVN